MLVYMLTNKVNGKRYIGVTGEMFNVSQQCICNIKKGRARIQEVEKENA